ncbi:MAG TPA: hypothetical protein C5S37_06455 [Methanophagales archaeon]|nr:hypothetical protein [Methanophagales archaeon]
MKHKGWKIGFGIWSILTGLVNFECWGYVVNSYLRGHDPFSGTGLLIFLPLAAVAVLFLAIDFIIGYFAFEKEK